MASLAYSTFRHMVQSLKKCRHLPVLMYHYIILTTRFNYIYIGNKSQIIL